MMWKPYFRGASKGRQRAPKSGHTLEENRVTQPLVRHRAFNRHDVITAGWYPLCRSKAVAVGEAQSLKIGSQRVVAYRGQDERVRVMDAFCPHMGADLANGSVVGNHLQCYFHQWRFDASGVCVGTRCGQMPSSGARVAAYATEERWGHIWVHAGGAPQSPLPVPPGLDGCDVDAWYLGRVRLFAHHHAMFAGGIDLQHFGSVHGLDADFEVEFERAGAQSAEWFVRGHLPARGSFRQRLGGALLGRSFAYRMRVGGGSVVAMSYGDSPRLFGSGMPLPAFHVLWGCVPQPDGVSEVEIFILAKRGDTAFARASSAMRKALTVVLLGALRDDDVKAFPNMRFQPRNLLREDATVVQLIQYINSLPVTEWSSLEAWEEETKRQVPGANVRRPLSVDSDLTASCEKAQGLMSQRDGTTP